MPTNKTALEMLIEKIKDRKIIPETNMDKYAYNTALEDVLIEAALLLPTERTQIEEAFDKGKYSFGIKASDYFTKKYKDGE